MECVHCKGELTWSTAPFSVHRNGYHLVWEAVPAWVCSQCGEAAFEIAESTIIHNVLRTLDQETEALASVHKRAS